MSHFLQTDPRLDQLREVLRDRRFDYAPQNRPRDFFDQIGEFARAFFDWYGRLDPLARAIGTATLLALLAAGLTWLVTRDTDLSPRACRIWIATVAALVFVIANIIFIIWGKDGPNINVLGLGPLGLLLLAIVIAVVGGAAFVLTARASSPASFAASVTVEERNLTSRQAGERASVQAAAGNYRDAIRYLYLTTLILLDERSLLRFDQSLTNREYLQRLAGTHLGSLLTPIIDTFDRTWYGHSEPTEQEYEQYAGWVEQVKNERNPIALSRANDSAPLPT